MIRRYFEEEMRYLHEAGKEFAQAHPELARYLNLDAVAERDPYVERLFEGFAFLTGRLRERMDDELPYYTESLFRLLHPHFLKPIPALTLLEFTPRPGMLQQTAVLARGLEVRSNPVGREAATCTFTTVYPVVLQPIRLADVQTEWLDGRRTVVTLRFKLDRGAEYAKLDLARLRLHLHAEAATASMMHLLFTRHLSRMVVRAGDEEAVVDGQQGVQAVGFGEDEGLVPYAKYSFTGYRLLQEFFSFRQKFWFVDLVGLDRLKPAASPSEFEVRLHFDYLYPEERRFKAENVRLFCTPAVNLFEADAEPIRVDHRYAEYRVVADLKQRRSVLVYDVARVVGMEETTGRRHEYRPFFGFGHTEPGARYYVETSRPGPAGTRETYLTIGGFGDRVLDLPAETLSLEVHCTNGNLPNEALQVGSLTRPGPNVPNAAAVTFKNLSPPTRELSPPTAEHRQFLWSLVSHLALNRVSLATPEALGGLLRLYDWTGSEANRRRIEGLRAVRWMPKETVYRGGIVRGAEVTVEVQDGHFPDDGDLHLFGTVLSTFFSLYATLNAFIHLSVVTVPSGRRFAWQPQKGSLPPL